MVAADTGAVASAEWFVSEVDTIGDTGRYASVAINSTSRESYVSYYDSTNQELRLARSSGMGPDCGPNSEWSCVTLDSGADVGKYSSIAVNPQTGGVGIAYHDATNGTLKYIYMANPHNLVYEIRTIDKGIEGISSTGLHTSLAYSPGGTAYIAYYFDNPTNVDALMLAYPVATDGNCGYGYAAGKWRCDDVTTGEGVGQYPSLTVVGSWDFRIAYYDAGNGDLWYARSASGGNCGLLLFPMACFPVSSAPDVGKYASQYVDDLGRFHIAYYDAASDTLKYAFEIDSGGNCGVLGSAQCDEIDDMQSDYHPLGVSIAEDGDGYPIIAYQAANGSLNLARPVAALGLPAGAGNCGPETPFSTWYCDTIDRHGTWINYRNADYASIAINSWGLSTIAYNGFITASGGNLNVARQRPEVNYLSLLLRSQ